MNFFRQLLFNNLGLKAISLVLAFLTWAQIPSRQTVQTTFTIPVEFTNRPDELEISNNYQRQVDVDIRSKLGSALEGQGLTAVIDLRNVSPGTMVVHLNEENIRNRPHYVDILSIRPSSIKLQLERIEAKIAKIEAEIAGQPADGYEVTGQIVTPPGVMLTGPQSRLEKVSSVLTEPLDIEGRSTSLRRSVSAYVDDPLVRIQDPKPVTVNIIIEEKRQEVQLRKVLVRVVPDGARVQLLTRRVDVVGTVPISFKEELKASDFLAIADVNQLQFNGQADEITPTIVVPAQYSGLFRTTSVTPSQVKVRNR